MNIIIINKGIMKTFLSTFLFLLFLNLIIGQDSDRYYCPIKIEDNILTNPYTGGMNSPQFNDMDINLDGHKDLVVFDRVGNKLMCFLSDGNTPPKYIFAPKYNNIFPEIENWMLLIDYNHDGIEDLFTSKNNGILVYKGQIKNNNIYFKELPNPYFDQNILSAKYENGFTFRLVCNDSDIPAIADIDFDGDLDVLSFTDGSSMSLFKNVCNENNISLDSFKMIQTTRCWGRFAENPFSEEILLSDDPYRCATWDGLSNRHSGSTTLAFDYDHDQDFDLLLGDVGYNSLIFLENNGDKTNAWCTKKERDFPQYDTPVDMNVFLSAFYLDVDHDGEKDLIIAPNTEYDELDPPQNVENVHFYKGMEENNKIKFKFIKNNFLSDEMLDFGINSVPVFTDVNGDSLLDIIVGTGPAVGDKNIIASKLLYFENTGSQTNPSFSLEDDDYLNLSKLSNDFSINYFAPAFGDLDGDGDNDLLVGNNNGTLIYFKNIAGKNNKYKFEEPVIEYKGIDIFSYSSPLIYDINKDGLGDILIGCGNDYHTPLQYYGSIVYYQNTGEKDNPDFINDPFTAPNTPFFGKIILSNFSTSISNAHLSVYRDDDDELLFAGYKAGNINFYKNFSQHIHDNLTPEIREYNDIDVGKNSAPAVADIDGDGYLEMLIGSKTGGLEFWNTNIKVKDALNTEDSNYNEKISIYPIPFKDEITIDINYNFGKNISYSIYDTVGAMLIHKKLYKGDNKIRLNKLKNGVYFIKVSSDTNYKTFKIIKSN